MVNTSPPEQETEAQNRHIPPEIVEQILLNLSIKSLLRFSCVAASWNSTITSPQFIAKHGGGRKMVIINDNPSFFDVRDAFCSPLSTITDRHVRNAAPSNDLVCPFQVDVKLKAFCDGLFCISAKKSLYLWNPSTGACKKLPDAPPLHTDRWWLKPALTSKVFYGLGRDAADDDDYKLLEIWTCDFSFREKKSFIYSLKSDSWREVLYLYDDGRIVIWACSGYKKSDIIVYKGSEVVAHSKMVALNGAPAAGNPRSRVCGGFVYVESLVSPATIKWNLH